MWLAIPPGAVEYIKVKPLSWLGNILRISMHLFRFNVASESIGRFRRVVHWNHPLCRIDLGWTSSALNGTEISTTCVFSPSRLSSFHSLTAPRWTPGKDQYIISNDYFCREGFDCFFTVGYETFLVCSSLAMSWRVLTTSLQSFCCSFRERLQISMQKYPGRVFK